MLIINANLHPMDGPAIPAGWLRFGRTIEALGPMETCPAAAPAEPVLDAAGGWVLPGLVDAHSHLGMFADALGVEGDDLNEVADPITPQLRAIDAVNPFDRGFAEALCGGVTCVVTGPGSANPIAGQAVALKTWGRRVDDMIVRAPAAMKFALGENPKGCYRDRDESPQTRMATAALIREALEKAREYAARLERAAEDEDADPPDYDAKCAALLPVMRGELPAHFHAHQANDIFTALRIAGEFGLDAVIIHGTEGHLVADLLAEAGARVVAGPNMIGRGKPEVANLSEDNPAILARAGVAVAVCTDHPETPEGYLPFCAALAARGGMAAEDALAAITSRAAEIVGLDARVGSLTPGKDADVAVFSGDPLRMDTRVRAVFVDGVQRVRDGALI